MRKIIKRLFRLFLLAGIIGSCARNGANTTADEGQLTGAVYENKTIGWSIRIPEGWQVMSRENLEQQTRKGIGHISEATGTDVDYSGLKYLISFRKDQFNSFQSTAEPFQETDETTWADNTAMIREILVETYFHKGIRIDTASTVEHVNGLPFDVFRMTLFGQNGRVVLRQEMYSRLINGQSFGVIMNYNNQADHDAMINAFRNSRFRRR